MSDDQIIPESDVNQISLADEPAAQDENEETVDNSKIDHDPLLQELVAYANRWDISAVVTLNLGGSMVSGTIISNRNYLEKFAAEYRQHLSNTPEAGNALAELILSYKPADPKEGDPLPAQRPSFINLKDVRTYAPGRPQITINSTLWRGNISEVKGFFLGAPPAPESN